MMNTLIDFEQLLAESVRMHGHLCAGQVLGVRMSLLGLQEAGILDPKGKDRKNLIVFVEMDRCAIERLSPSRVAASVTGRSNSWITEKWPRPS